WPTTRRPAGATPASRCLSLPKVSSTSRRYTLQYHFVARTAARGGRAWVHHEPNPDRAAGDHPADRGDSLHHGKKLQSAQSGGRWSDPRRRNLGTQNTRAIVGRQDPG